MSQGPSKKVTGSLGPEGPWWRSGPKGITLPVLEVSRVLSEGDRPPYTETWKPLAKTQAPLRHHSICPLHLPIPPTTRMKWPWRPPALSRTRWTS